MTRNITQTGIVNNEASSAGPSVEFTNQTPGGLAATEITTPSPNIKFDVQAQTGATAIRFAVDGVILDTASSPTATFTWKIDSGGTHVPDGTYLVMSRRLTPRAHRARRARATSASTATRRPRRTTSSEASTHAPGRPT